MCWLIGSGKGMDACALLGDERQACRHHFQLFYHGECSSSVCPFGSSAAGRDGSQRNCSTVVKDRSCSIRNFILLVQCISHCHNIVMSWTGIRYWL
ncbi:hypothetical protein SUGI_0029900 [Cryptomeria japonica]|nr:hypothetical protein SUGI_0029900 [Cryptomeria japonica]